MIAFLRRSRSAALLLLLANPGIIGVALEPFHPCPAHEVAQAAAGHHTGAGHHHDGTPARPDSDCHCFGACHAGSGVAPLVEPPAVPSRTVAAVVAPPAVSTTAAPVGIPADRLPPKTGPPLA